MGLPNAALGEWLQRSLRCIQHHTIELDKDLLVGFVSLTQSRIVENLVVRTPLDLDGTPVWVYWGDRSWPGPKPGIAPLEYWDMARKAADQPAYIDPSL